MQDAVQPLRMQHEVSWNQTCNSSLYRLFVNERTQIRRSLAYNHAPQVEDTAAWECQRRPDSPELAGKDTNWLNTPKDSLYAHYLDELTAGVPKLIALKQLIESLGEDVYGRPEKLVIFTSSPVVSHIVALVSFPLLPRCSFGFVTGLQWLKKHFPKKRHPTRGTLWCSAAFQLKDRDTDIVRPFEDDDEHGFLVSTKRLMGTSVSLTRAFRSVNLDADWEGRLLCTFQLQNQKSAQSSSFVNHGNRVSKE